jgi:exodeoxyribonuclease VIII
MIDLETMGNGPRAAIIAIGAVEMDLSAGLLGQTFYRVVDLESSVTAGLEVDSSTIIWWLKQGDEARAAISKNGGPLIDALIDFTAWLQQCGDRKDLCIWGNGATFDNVVLASAYKAVGLLLPWTYKGDRCYRTVRAMYPDIVADHSEAGVAHHALADAVYQANHLIKILGPRGA